MSVIAGNDLDNTLVGGDGGDTIFGLGGSDSLTGLPGADLIEGGDGRDSLDGQEGGDTLRGGNGDDIHYGGDGADSLVGQEGFDGFWPGPGADTVDGGTGVNEVDYLFSPAPVSVDLRLTGPQGGGGDAEGDVLISIDYLLGSFFFNDTLIGNDEGNLIRGVSGDDSVAGLGGDDFLDGHDDDDLVEGGDGRDSLQGGRGSDTLDGGDDIDEGYYLGAFEAVVVDLSLSGPQPGAGEAQGDVLISIENLIGSFFDDVLAGDAGPNLLGGSDGSDTIEGRDGDDTLTGWRDVNLIDGGAGLDTALVVGGRADYRAVQTDTGLILLRADPLEYQIISNVEFVEFEDVTLAATIPGTETVIGIDGQVVLGTDGPDFLGGGPLNDSIAGGGGGDTLVGLDGDDVVDGGAGYDLIFDAGTGDDSLSGGPDADYIDAYSGNDTIDLGANELSVADIGVGGAGDDLILGGIGHDVMFGGEGDDWLIGGEGPDFILGEGGADAMDAGEGDTDRVHVSWNDILALGGEGIFDALVLEDVSQGFDEFDLGHTENQNTSGVGPMVRGFEVVDGSIAQGPFRVIGASTEGRGNVLIGGGFDDALSGSDAIDILFGGNGNDDLDISKANDTATGGDGADVFNYQGVGDAGEVLIQDFAAVDWLLIEDSLGMTEQEIVDAFVQVGADAVLTLGPGRSITLAGVQTDDLSAANILLD